MYVILEAVNGVQSREINQIDNSNQQSKDPENERKQDSVTFDEINASQNDVDADYDDFEGAVPFIHF